MTTSFFSKARASADPLAGSNRYARFLFFSGWGITLLYFPSGLLHHLLGGGVYARDVLMFIHLGACLHWLLKAGRLAPFLRRGWMLAVPAVFVLPAVFDRVFTVEALTFIKWTALWLDWIILGKLAWETVTGLNGTIIIFTALTTVLLVADLSAGFYEKATDAYIIDTRGETSAFGVEEGKELNLKQHLRVKGLQRDVFSFSNLMAMSCVGGLLLFVACPTTSIRFGSLVWSAAFGAGMFTSGGRSAFFGVFASILAAGGLLILPEKVRGYYGRIVLAWLLVALGISFLGVGRLTESIGGSVMSDSHIGNSDSAYARDANWAGIIDAIEGNPVVLVSGAPMAALLDPKVDAIYHWADNQYMWLIYHSGVVGLTAVCLFFMHMLRSTPAGENSGSGTG